MQALGRYAPQLHHLKLDLGCDRTLTATGLRALPGCLQTLSLSSTMDLLEHEVQVRLLLDRCAFSWSMRCRCAFSWTGAPNPGA